MNTFIGKINSLSSSKKIIIGICFLIVFGVGLYLFTKSSSSNEDKVYNVNTKTFQESVGVSSSQKLDESITELKSDKDTSLTINEGEIVNISESEKDKLKTDNLQKEIIKETIKKEEEKNLGGKTEITNANDIELSKKEIKISGDLENVKLTYNEIQKNIGKEFNKLGVSEQENIIKTLNSELGKDVFTKKNYNIKIKKILKYLTKEKEYVMIEKLTTLGIKDILNGNFLQTLKSDRMLYNNAILEIL